MDDALLVGMLDALADAHEKGHALVARERVGLAVVGERDALDVFHGDVGMTLRCRACIEDLRDRRMLHLRQGLALDFEPGQRQRTRDLFADQLEGDISMHGGGLLGQVDLAHAAFA